MDTHQRTVAAGVMDTLVKHRGECHYLEHRPMETIWIDSMPKLLEALARGEVRFDCSESITMVFHIAGAHSPVGNYSGYGNTDSMLRLPKFYNAAEANICSIAVFNADRPLPEQHAAVVRHPDHKGGNPVMFTNGGPGQPVYMRYHNLQFGFTGRTDWCSVAHL